MAQTVWINKTKLNEFIINEDSISPLADGQIRLKIESFAVTANNVTYAVAGDSFGYWNFFPANEGYGIVPMWGHAIVEESNHPEIKAGERLYGYLPMGSYLDVKPDKISQGSFTDVIEHRQPMAPIYNSYQRLDSDPEHDPAREDARMIYGPLFKTGFLIENFMKRENWFGANHLIMTSASSKTSISLAHCAKLSSPEIKRIGLTSAGNVAFVESTGLYDEILTYDQVDALPDANYVSVDFAGNTGLLRSIHAKLDAKLKYSCLVGMTHIAAREGSGEAFAGPPPILFFAPDHATAALKEMGAKTFGQAIAVSWQSLLPLTDQFAKVRHASGMEEAAKAYTTILNNKADPSVGIVIKP